MTVQLILRVPSGMSVTSSEFIKGGGGQYTATYMVQPGDIRQIEVHIMTNQPGDFTVTGDILNYFGDDKSTEERGTVDLPVKVMSSIVKHEENTEPSEGGGFSCSGPDKGTSASSGGV